MYKIQGTSTVNSIKIGFLAASLSFPIISMNVVENNQTLNNDDFQITTYQIPANKYVGILPNLSQISESMIKLKQKVEQFLINPKIDDSCLSSLRNSVNDGLCFLNHFPRELPLPTASYAEDGEVVLEWFLNNNKSVVLNIAGDGYYGYALLQQGKYLAGQSDGDINSIIPLELYEYFQS